MKLFLLPESYKFNGCAFGMTQVATIVARFEPVPGRECVVAVFAQRWFLANNASENCQLILVILFTIYAECHFFAVV